nr:acyltransferase [Marinilactibacillus sp. 15R]
MIVIWHLCVHGIQSSIQITDLSRINQFLFYLIESITVIAVNLYVLISGYFLYNKNKPIMSKVFRLVLETFAFTMTIFLFLLIIGEVKFSNRYLLLSIFSIFYGKYWFITVYIVMFTLSPYLNIVIRYLSKKQHLQLLAILFFIEAIWQFMHVVDAIGVNDGYSVFHFIFLYFLAAFLGKYGFVIRDFNKYIYLSGFFSMTMVNTIISYLSPSSIDKLFRYNSPVIIFSAFCLFMFFKKISFQSKLINRVSKYTLGIYLVHEHFFIRPLLWGDIGVVQKVLSGPESFFVIRIIVFGILVFGVCWIIAYIISNIFNLAFNYFGNIFNKSKLFTMISSLLSLTRKAIV